MAEDVVKQGDKVQAKWPGSRRYENATVVRVQAGGRGYEVKYSDGTTSVVKAGDVKKRAPSVSVTKKASTPSKSPARARSRSPSKSPSRSPKKARSTSRGRKTERSQSRSPARTKAASPSKARSRSRSKSKTATKTPAVLKTPTKAKTPTKTKTPTKPKTPPRTPSPSRKAKPKSIEKKTDESVERPKSPARKKQTPKAKDLFSSPETSPSPIKKKKAIIKDVESPEGLKKRGRPKKYPEAELVPLLTKLTKIQTLERVVQEQEPNERKIYSTRSKIAQRSDLSELRVGESSTDGTRLKVGFVGVAISTLAIFALPAFAIYLSLSCVRKRTTIFSVPQLPKASLYFSSETALVYLSFVLIQAVLNALPLGKVVRGFYLVGRKTPLLYRLNGLYSLLISVALLGALGYFGQPLNFVHDHFFKLTCSAVAFSFVLSVILYINALYRPLAKVSQYGNTGCTPYDFYHGRELNPRIGARYDIKMMVVRSAYIGWIVVNSCLLHKAYLLHGCIHWEMALTAGAQIIYALHLLFKEELVLATASVMHGGLGFGVVHSAYVLSPFTFTVPTYYLVHQKHEYPIYCLVGMAILYVLGLYINRSSLRTKMLVKRNPEDPAVTGQKLIVSSDLKKPLVASGWWGLVRHPNYASEILMFIAWTLPCGFQSNVPYLPIVLFSLLLLRRTFQVEAIMAQNYPVTYNQYKHRVPYRLFPYVF